MRLPSFLGLGVWLLVLPVRAEDRPVTAHPVHDRAQRLEHEVKTERDRPHKEERARAAGGRVEDGVREFGRGLQRVMGEAGIGDGPPRKPAEKNAKAVKSRDKPAPAASAKPPASASKAPASPTK